MPGPRWITAIGGLRGTDLFATGEPYPRSQRTPADAEGSWDGHIRLWALDAALRIFKPLQTIPVAGFVNSIQILSVPAASVKSETWSGTVPAVDVEMEGEVTQKKDKDKREILLVAAIAPEPRLGRWMSVKGVKSGVFVAHLKFGEAEKESEGMNGA
jgi:ribosomal RNA-processing protein 9